MAKGEKQLKTFNILLPPHGASAFPDIVVITAEELLEDSTGIRLERDGEVVFSSGQYVAWWIPHTYHDPVG